MSGFELRLWRRGMGWDQERAAEELGISLRTYKRYEKKAETATVLNDKIKEIPNGMTYPILRSS